MTPTDQEFDERGGSLFTERTELAWARSGLALLATFAIVARRVWVGGSEPDGLLGVALLGFAALGWSVGILGWRLTHSGRGAARPRQAGELLAVAAGTVALAGAGLVLGFVDT